MKHSYSLRVENSTASTKKDEKKMPLNHLAKQKPISIFVNS